MTGTILRPPFDPELEAALLAGGDDLVRTVTVEMIPTMRETPMIDIGLDALEAAGVTHREIKIDGFQGASISVSIMARADHTGTGPGILHTHGGGMIVGSPMTGMHILLPWIVDHHAVVVSVDYRLAPEFPDPFPVEDCYAALVWTAHNAADLGIAADRLLIAGLSAGGGLAAGICLLARDRGGPGLTGQILMSPMLDDRNNTVSSMQFDGVGLWNRASNVTGWTALLGSRRATDCVSIYAAPARANDLSGLPPAFIDCGSAEVFRDEIVSYATALWHAGVQAELHVWAGGFHGFDMMSHTALAQAATLARASWLARHLSIEI